MKKFLIVLTIVLLLFFLIGISINYLFTKLFENPVIVSLPKYENPVIASLPKYENSDCYYGEGFQDYTDYCKYYFSENDTIIEHLKENKYFKSVTANDVEEVKGYFENFKGWVEYEEYKDKYDFTYECVDTSDYFYIENKDTCEKYKNYPDKYEAYNVYFFDVQTKTLYYIHSNI